ncbi:type IX secretion system anionic LPS delivery protein PorZ [Chryseobacterium caseinilyticum]|uniref:T9SS type A sorting domain-containing protein n=1 Tax=Chryseobacterium caseinilyticum TaxID=2771428 RepID=A0ABR8ZAS3_9FLAO|nr:T9SS type A sorting domain-containing protein [Chryseobacterium caseinilyticum]MBD8082419.1 T9SS type A sorting domain-containing protein [Chryseobacterium caseinilyticum]
MKKLLISLGILATLQLADAQNITSKKWADMFSYNNVLAMKEDNGKIIAGTENGVFYYNISSGEISKLSKASGLHEVKISAFDYDPQSKIALVGYQSGALDVIAPDGITYIVDIPLATGYTGSKRINHISITGDQAVISVGYGVSIFKLKKKEFADSAFFVIGGTFEASNEATIFGNKVYSVTNTGLKSHELNTTFPVFTTWTTEQTGNFKHIDSDGSLSYASTTTAYLYNNGTSTPISQTFTNVKDVVTTSGNVTVTDNNRVYSYADNGNFIGSASPGEECNTSVRISGKFYFGTALSGIKNENSNIFKPDGPAFNYSYKIRPFNDNQLLVSSGGREGGFNFRIENPRNPGFYYFNGSEWVYPSYFATHPNTYNILDAMADPQDPSIVFFSNYSIWAGMGVYKMKYNPANKDFDFVKYYDIDQPSIYINRPVGFAADDKNNIFLSVAFNVEGSNVAMAPYKRDTDEFLVKTVTLTSSAVQAPVFHEGLLWTALPRSQHIMAYDYKGTVATADDTAYIIGAENNLPANTLAVAFDKDGDAWIGTDLGIRILPNAATEVKNNPTLEAVVIEQNGLAEELFRDSQILAIEVDAGNQKWVAVDGGGVYYLSADGERTIKHFTRENSPLPTNSVTDIKIDKKTGKVYFVTYDGIVTYQGDVADVTSNFGNVLVYPNPVVYNQFKGKVTIKGLAEVANIRITDAAGNIVHSAQARTGYYEWDLNNQKGKRVASGIYFVLMTNEDGTDKATAKIAVVN